MPVFVTGGTGFIGSHLVDDLLRDGVDDVRCLVRSNPKWLEGKPVNRIKGDLHDLPVLLDAMEGVDTIYHNAGVVKARDSRDFERGNVEATENLIRVARKKGVKRIVILSSLAAVGPSDGTILTEASPFKPVSRYGVSKQRMEERVRELAGDDTITILRPAAVYGPREEDIYTVFKAASKGIFPIVGTGLDTPVSLVHVADVVQAIRAAGRVENPGVHTYFVGSERGYTWAEIKDATAAALGRKLRTLRVSAGLVRKAGDFSESLGALIGRYPVLNRDKAAELVREWNCSVDKAVRELHYRQTVDLNSGIRDTIAWYRKHNWL